MPSQIPELNDENVGKLGSDQQRCHENNNGASQTNVVCVSSLLVFKRVRLVHHSSVTEMHSCEIWFAIIFEVLFSYFFVALTRSARNATFWIFMRRLWDRTKCSFLLGRSNQEYLGATPEIFPCAQICVPQG